MKIKFMAMSLLVLTVMAGSASLVAMDDSYDYGQCCGDSVTMRCEFCGSDNCDGSCIYAD